MNSNKSYVFLTDKASAVFSSATGGPKVKITHFMPIYDNLMDPFSRELSFTGGNETKYKNKTKFERQYYGRINGMISSDGTHTIPPEDLANKPSGQYILNIDSLSYRMSTTDEIIINDEYNFGKANYTQRAGSPVIVSVGAAGALPLTKSYSVTGGREISSECELYKDDIGKFKWYSNESDTYLTVINPDPIYTSHVNGIFETNSNKVYTTALDQLFSNVTYKTSRINVADANEAPEYRTVGTFTCAIGSRNQLGEFMFNKIAMFATNQNNEVYYVGSAYMTFPIVYESSGTSNNEVIIDIIVDFQANNINGVTETAKFYGSEFAFWSYVTGDEPSGDMDHLHAFQRIFIGRDPNNPTGGTPEAQEHIAITGDIDIPRHTLYHSMVDDNGIAYGEKFSTKTDVHQCYTRVNEDNPGRVIKFWERINESNDYEFMAPISLSGTNVGGVNTDEFGSGRYVFSRSIVPMNFTKYGSEFPDEPGDMSINLGSESERFYNVYARSISIDNILGVTTNTNQSGNITIHNNLIPSTHNLIDLGKDSRNFRSLSIQNVYASNEVVSTHMKTTIDYVQYAYIDKLMGNKQNGVMRYEDGLVISNREKADAKLRGLQLGTPETPIKAISVHAIFATHNNTHPLYVFADIIPGSQIDRNEIAMKNFDGESLDTESDTEYDTDKTLGLDTKAWGNVYTKRLTGRTLTELVNSGVSEGVNKFTRVPNDIRKYVVSESSMIPHDAFAVSLGRPFTPYSHVYAQSANISNLSYIVSADTQMRKPSQYTSGILKWSQLPDDMKKQLPNGSTQFDPAKEFDFLYTTLDTDLIPSDYYRSQIGAPNRGIRAIFTHDIYGSVTSGDVKIHSSIIPSKDFENHLKNPEGVKKEEIHKELINLGSNDKRFDHAFIKIAHINDALVGNITLNRPSSSITFNALAVRIRHDTVVSSNQPTGGWVVSVVKLKSPVTITGYTNTGSAGIFDVSGQIDIGAAIPQFLYDNNPDMKYLIEDIIPLDIGDGEIFDSWDDALPLIPDDIVSNVGKYKLYMEFGKFVEEYPDTLLDIDTLTAKLTLTQYHCGLLGGIGEDLWVNGILELSLINAHNLNNSTGISNYATMLVTNAMIGIGDGRFDQAMDTSRGFETNFADYTRATHATIRGSMIMTNDDPSIPADKIYKRLCVIEVNSVSLISVYK